MHVLEFFGDGCRLCDESLASVRAAKCSECELVVFDTRAAASKAHVRRYEVDVVPTLIVDQRVKVEGHLDGRWLCQGSFSPALEQKFPLVPTAEPASIA